jgi:hypothetical protein
VQAQGTRTYAGCHNSWAYHHLTGKERLHVHFLKPSSLEVVQKQLQDICDANIADQSRWIEYRTLHPIILWLPSKLATWIGDNYGEELGIPLPCLYICPAANVLGRAPLIPCFIDSNTHLTIPYKFKNSRLLGSASADTQLDRGNSSRLYEVPVNLWLWCYGLGQPRTISIEEAEAARQDQVS